MLYMRTFLRTENFVTHHKGAQIAIRITVLLHGLAWCLIQGCCLPSDCWLITAALPRMLIWDQQAIVFCYLCTNCKNTAFEMRTVRGKCKTALQDPRAMAHSGVHITLRRQLAAGNSCRQIWHRHYLTELREIAFFHCLWHCSAGQHECCRDACTHSRH